VVQLFENSSIHLYFGLQKENIIGAFTLFQTMKAKQSLSCISHFFIHRKKEKKKKTFQFCTSLDYKNHVRTTSSYQIPTSFDHRWIIAGLFYVHCVYVRALMNWRNQDFLGLTLNMGHN